MFSKRAGVCYRDLSAKTFLEKCLNKVDSNNAYVSAGN